MSVTVRDPPQRRRSLGPVSPKRIYRNLSVRLRGRDTDPDREGPECTKYYSKGAAGSLWGAVESGDVLMVRTLLCEERLNEGGEGDVAEERDRAVNSINELGLVPLDVAILTHNAPLLQVLVKAGARHNPNLSKPSDWSAKLDELVSLAERKMKEKRAEIKVLRTGLSAQADANRALHQWSLWQELYTQMRDTFHLTELPSPPSAAALLVTSDTTLRVSITPPQHTAGLITTYRVEWSTCGCFSSVTGCGFITGTKTPAFHITGLETGVQYYVRVSAYNIKGWSPPQSSSPLSATPSSWRQCSNVKIRGSSQEEAMRKLLQQIREPTYREHHTENLRRSGSVKRVSVSRGFRLFFHSANKFVRLLQRGVYLATVLYQKENILVTAEDLIPLVEIQCCSTSVIQDFLWFAKLSCAWQQVPWLQQEVSSSLSSSSSLLQNRHNILRAVNQLQISLGCVDLGQVYFEPLKDRHGNVLLVTLREVVTPLTPADPQLHWSPVKHLETHWSRTRLLPEPTALETLTQQLRKMLEYHRRSLSKSQPGLYVGMLKLCSSVEQLRVFVPQRLPNLLFHARVRTHTHVSREEWSWLQRHSVGGVSGSSQTMTGCPEGVADCLIDSSGVEEFVRDLRTAVTQLLTKLNIPTHRVCQYRVYTQELVQVCEGVALLLLLPPSEEFSSSFWPLEGTVDPWLSLPLHMFELVYFWVYNRELLSLYCECWVRLQVHACVSQQALREALDTREAVEARERLTHITQLSQSVEAVWRERRWILDVMQCVRSRQHSGAVPLYLVMCSQPIKTHPEEEEEKRLQPPHTHTHSTAGGAVRSSLSGTQTGRTLPVNIPGVKEGTGGVATENEATHSMLNTDLAPPSPYMICNDASHSIPDTSRHGNHAHRHSSGTFHHSGGIHHTHSCPEFSAFPSSALSEEDEERNLGELVENLNIQEENMTLMLEIESVLENMHHTDSLRNTDLESDVAVGASTAGNTDLKPVLEDAHHTASCTNIVTDLESVYGCNAVRDTDLESVLEVSEGVRDGLRPAVEAQLIHGGFGFPGRSLVEWVTSSTDLEAEQ